MDEITKILLIPFLNKLIIQVEQNNYWLIVFIFILFLLSIYTIIKYIPFYYSNRKIINEIGKIDHENIKYLLDNTETVRKLKDLKTKYDNLFFEEIKKVKKLFSENELSTLEKQTIINQFIVAFRKCSFDKFTDYMNAYEILHKNDKEKIHAFIKYELKLLLDNLYTFMIIINSDYIRNISEHNEYIIDESEIFHYYLFVKQHTRFYNIQLRTNFNNSLKKINISINLFSISSLIPKKSLKQKTNSA